MGTRDPASGTAPAVTLRRRPRSATVALLALYVAAATVGLAVGGAVERLLGLALLAAVALRLLPYRRAVRRSRADVPPAAARVHAAGNGDTADA